MQSVDHRLQRREMWISLWLMRLVAVAYCFAGASFSRIWREWFDECTRRLARQVGFVMVTIMVRKWRRAKTARRMIDPRAPKHYVVRPRDVVGSKIRRALRAKTPLQKLEKLLRVFKAREFYARERNKTLRAGMTRKLFAHTRAQTGGDEKALALSRVSVAEPNSS
jgi:hypothetical protein